MCVCLLMFLHRFRPPSASLGRAPNTEIFRNRKDFKKVRMYIHTHMLVNANSDLRNYMYVIRSCTYVHTYVPGLVHAPG